MLESICPRRDHPCSVNLHSFRGIHRMACPRTPGVRTVVSPGHHTVVSLSDRTSMQDGACEGLNTRILGTEALQ